MQEKAIKSTKTAENDVFYLHLQLYFRENQGKMQDLAKIERNAQNQGKSGIYTKNIKIQENPRKYINIQYTISTTPAPGRPYFRAVAAI